MSADRPFLTARARVDTVERVSPTFARVTFGGNELAAFGSPGQTFDQRIKIVFPPEGRPVPDLSGDPDWYAAWLALPDAERGAMRTYSIRELRVDDAGTRVVVDFVLHLAPGASGPASLWASAAAEGDEVLLIGPRRGRAGAGGIEYAPGEAARVLLAGDETAAPAIARILEDSDPGLRGVAFVEVPHADDALPISAPPGVELRWIARSGLTHGEALIPAVLDYLGASAPAEIADIPTEDLLWETPNYSGLGEELAAAEADSPETYFWIAGESGVATTLRRQLVRELGVERQQVAFMGYWRRGVAMRG